MRYKCVMPMIVEQEAQERERQRKKGEEKKEEDEEEEEERSTVKVEGNMDAEIDESKKRIYEHFKHISQAANETIAKKKKKKSTNLVLGQMHGRKRKRESEIGRRETSDDSEFSVPTPSPDVQIARRSKKIKKETIVKQKIKQETLAQAPSASDTENIKSIR